MNKCYICGYPTRRGFPMITQENKEVIICERCKRLWRKAKAEEERAKGEENNV